MAWQIAGNYIENCNCEQICPCTSAGIGNAVADYDRCTPLLAFEVTDGAIEGVDVSGTGVLAVADTPADMGEGNWRLGLLIDAGSDEQAEALEQVFSGALGGPMGALAPLIGEFLGVERVSLAFSHDGRNHRVEAGGLTTVAVEDRVQEPNEESVCLTGLAHPANSTLTVARVVEAHNSAFGMEWSGTDKSGFSSTFAWTG